MVRITNVGKVPIRDQKQQWNKDNIQIFVLSLYLGWSRSGWAPRSSRNTWSQRASRKHRQRWAAGPPRRAGETLAFYLTWSFVPVSVLRSLILQLLRLIYESHCAEDPAQKTRCSFSLSWTLYSVLGSDILHLLLHLCSWQMLPYQWHGFKNTWIV